MDMENGMALNRTDYRPCGAQKVRRRVTVLDANSGNVNFKSNKIMNLHPLLVL